MILEAYPELSDNFRAEMAMELRVGPPATSSSNPQDNSTYLLSNWSPHRSTAASNSVVPTPCSLGASTNPIATPTSNTSGPGATNWLSSTPGSGSTAANTTPLPPMLPPLVLPPPPTSSCQQSHYHRNIHYNHRQTTHVNHQHQNSHHTHPVQYGQHSQQHSYQYVQSTPNGLQSQSHVTHHHSAALEITPPFSNEDTLPSGEEMLLRAPLSPLGSHLATPSISHGIAAPQSRESGPPQTDPLIFLNLSSLDGGNGVGITNNGVNGEGSKTMGNIEANGASNQFTARGYGSGLVDNHGAVTNRNKRPNVELITSRIAGNRLPPANGCGNGILVDSNIVIDAKGPTFSSDSGMNGPRGAKRSAHNSGMNSTGGNGTVVRKGNGRRNGKRRKTTPQSSNFCHVCVRSGEQVRLAACANVITGSCRKAVCEKCFDKYGWKSQWAEAERNTTLIAQWRATTLANTATESTTVGAGAKKGRASMAMANVSLPASAWTCVHCREQCPPSAQCAIYAKTNMKRHLFLKQRKKGRMGAAAAAAATQKGLEVDKRQSVAALVSPMTDDGSANSSDSMSFSVHSDTK